MNKPPLTTDDLDMAQIMQWLADNQLPNGNTFLQPGSVGSTLISNGAVSAEQMAPQAIGSVSGTPSIANGAAIISAWTTFLAGTYSTAASAGLTATATGTYLIRGTIRWDAGTTGLRFFDISVGGAGVNGGGFGAGQPASAVQPTATVCLFWPVTSGQVISLATSNGQGSAVTPAFARVDAVLMFS